MRNLIKLGEYLPILPVYDPTHRVHRDIFGSDSGVSPKNFSPEQHASVDKKMREMRKLAVKGLTSVLEDMDPDETDKIKPVAVYHSNGTFSVFYNKQNMFENRTFSSVYDLLDYAETLAHSRADKLHAKWSKQSARGLRR